MAASGLRERGSDSRWLYRRGPRANLAPWLAGSGWLQAALGWDLSLLSAKRLRTRRGQILHLYDPWATFGAGMTALLARSSQTILSVHDDTLLAGGCLGIGPCSNATSGCRHCPSLGTWPLEPKGLASAEWNFRMLDRMAEEACCSLLAPSDWMARRLAASRWKSRRIHVLANPVAPVFSSDAARSSGKSMPRKFLSVASQLDAPWKGVLELLDWWEKRPTEHQRSTLALAGGASEKLQGRIRGTEGVHWLGAKASADELASVYRSHDVLLHPSTIEQTPLVISEALSCGLSVLSRPVGAIAEQCASLAAKQAPLRDWWSVIEALSNSERQRTLARERFSLETHTKGLQAIYEQMMAPHIEATPIGG